MVFLIIGVVLYVLASYGYYAEVLELYAGFTQTPVGTLPAAVKVGIGFTAFFWPVITVVGLLISGVSKVGNA